MEAAHQDRQKPFVDAAARALDEVRRGREERARLTKSMSPGALRAAARTRDAYFERTVTGCSSRGRSGVRLPEDGRGQA